MCSSVLFQELALVNRSRKGANRRNLQQVTEVTLLASNSSGRLETPMVFEGFSNLVVEYAEELGLENSRG